VPVPNSITGWYSCCKCLVIQYVPPWSEQQVSLPTFELGLPAYYVLAVSEASSNLARYDGVRYGSRDAEAKELQVGHLAVLAIGACRACHYHSNPSYLKFFCFTMHQLAKMCSAATGPKSTTAVACSPCIVGARVTLPSPTPHSLLLQAMYTATRDLGLGPEVKRRILMGTYALSAGYYDAVYKKAQQVRTGPCRVLLLGPTCGCLSQASSSEVAASGCCKLIREPRKMRAEEITRLHLPLCPQVRTLIKQELAQALGKYDALLSPAAPTTAYKLGEKSKDPLSMYKGDLCTTNINLAGLPALTLPVGFTQVCSCPVWPMLSPCLPVTPSWHLHLNNHPMHAR
jgi:Asp-tRNA(Asn)/Glu-tRNA(Gln) amidotransferase A subunit family amidase